MTKKEIEELLRKGAYGALMDDDKAGDEFCEEDIDQILQRRTQVIQIESEGKGSTFAKVKKSEHQELKIEVFKCKCMGILQYLQLFIKSGIQLFI